MKLSDTACKGAKPKEKAYKLSDGGGLFLQVTPKGAKYWRLKYRYLGKEKLMALGVYPTITLAEARERREEAKRLLANGLDPMAYKKAAKVEAVRNSENTFESVALEWHGKKTLTWAPKTAAHIMRSLKRDVFPHIGSRPIKDIDPPELLDVLRKIEDRGAHYQAGRLKQVCGQVFRYGVATGKCPRDPSADLKGALTIARTNHFAALGIKEMPEFLKTLERNDARLFPQTRRGIELLMLTFVRTSELINAKWDEIDFDKAIWEIPAERMKMGRPHVVPLSRQVIKLFKEQYEEGKHLSTEYVFPNQVRPQKPMSNNTILFGIKRLGYQGRMTGHGFRALAMTTLMEELNYPHEIPDTQLAHSKGDSVRRAYDRAQYLPQRTKMMQEWSDYIEALGKHGEVVQGNFGRVA